MKKIIPGLLACMFIASVAQVIGHFSPQMGSALWSILLGILAGNTFFTQQMLAMGVKFSESKLLEIAIALMGLTLNLQNILMIGWQGLLFVLLQMAGTLFFVYRLGRLLQFDKVFSLLMSAGNAVCGSSAIAAVSPIVKADEKDKGLSITTVNLTGTVLMIGLPILTGWLYQHDTIQTSAMIGGTLQSVGQVVAAGKLVNEDVTQYATVFKLLRVVFLVVVAGLFSRMNLKDNEPLFKRINQREKVHAKASVPWFIFAFLALCLLTTFIPVPTLITQTVKVVSNQLEIIALAGIGMRVKVIDLIREGPKAILYGLLTGTGQIILAVLLLNFFY